MEGQLHLFHPDIAPIVGPHGYDSTLTRVLYGEPKGPARTQVLNYGGGVQTTALCALIIEGKLPRPDHIIMADTGREGTATWDWLHGTVSPMLAQHGLKVEVAGHEFSNVDLFSGRGTVLMPMFTDQNRRVGGLGKLQNFCSGEWKVKVVQRYMRSIGIVQADNWIGISLDESDRTKRNPLLWTRTVFPLLDLGMARPAAQAAARRVFGADAPKSACFMCPHKGDSQWSDLKNNWPEDFALAVAVERHMQEANPHVFLHRSGVTLDRVAFGSAEDSLSCAADGGCWT